MKFKRILLKLSGESLMGQQGYGIDTERLNEYATQIREIVEAGVQVGIVIGGGNIFRGLSGANKGFDRVKGDQMGMCATGCITVCSRPYVWSRLASITINGKLVRRWSAAKW